MILGRRAHHGRAADVDVLDRFLERAARLRDGGGKRIEIDDDEVDRLDAVLAHDGVVDAAPAEQSAVDLRMQRLDAAVHDFGKTGDGRHIGDLDAVGAQHLRRAAGREQRDAATRELTRELEQAFLVRDAEQCAADRDVVTSASFSEQALCGRRTRSRSDARLSLRSCKPSASCAACRD